MSLPPQTVNAGAKRDLTDKEARAEAAKKARAERVRVGKARFTERRLALGFETDAAYWEDHRLQSQVDSVLPCCDERMNRQILRLCHDFVEAHKGSEGLGDGVWEGRERDRDGLIGRAVEFTCLRFLESVQLDSITGETLLNADGHPQYMTIPALRHLCILVWEKISFISYPALDSTAASEELLQFATSLILEYHLKMRGPDRLVITLEDLRSLTKVVFEDPEGTHDAVVQDHLLILFAWFFGARPGWYLLDGHFANKHLKWKHVTFYLAYHKDTMEPLGWTVLVEMEMPDEENSSRRVKPTRASSTILVAKDICFDLPNALLAHGFRQGAFGTRTFAELREKKLMQFKCDPSFEDRPVFVSNRGQANSPIPMSSKEAGHVVQVDTGNILYAFRRGLALRIATQADLDCASDLIGRAPTPWYDRLHERTNTKEYKAWAKLGHPPGRGRPPIISAEDTLREMIDGEEDADIMDDDGGPDHDVNECLQSADCGDYDALKQLEGDGDELETLTSALDLTSPSRKTPTKKQRLEAMIGLIRSPGGVCAFCQTDSTAPKGMKDLIWASGFELPLHQLEYHSTYEYSLRWMSAPITNGQWRCPVISVKRIPLSDTDRRRGNKPVVTRTQCTCVTATPDSNDLSVIRQHLVSHNLSGELGRAIEPSTMDAVKAEMTKTKKRALWLSKRIEEKSKGGGESSSAVKKEELGENVVVKREPVDGSSIAYVEIKIKVETQ